MRFVRYADDVNIFVKSEMAADRVMKSVCSWLERKLFLKVSAEKTKVVKPTNGMFLGFTFCKDKTGWKCKPADDRKKRLYDKIRLVLCRRKAVARPLSEAFTKVNQIVRGWINYFSIGSMKTFIDIFGQWLRHRIRVIIIKQWKKGTRIYKNLQRINEMFRMKMTEEDIRKVSGSRLGWYRRCGMSSCNYLLSPKILGKANKRANRPGLVNPLDYYLLCKGKLSF